MTAPETMCANCKQRPGTKKWVGEGGALALSHGFYAMWCEVCVLTAQLEHARSRVAEIPKMEARLAELLSEVSA